MNLPFGAVTYLPMLAEYFEVSVDQLIGIVPLSEETYSASKTSTKEFWEQKLEYLLRTRNNMWNDFKTYDYSAMEAKVIDLEVNGEKVAAATMTYAADAFAGEGVKIKKGKKVFHRAQM